MAASPALGGGDGALKNARAKLIDEREIELDSHAGRELHFQTEDGRLTGKARLFLVGDRLYQVLMATPDKEFNAEKADAFLKGFKLEEEPKE
jgi:hypothetical protein